MTGQPQHVSVLLDRTLELLAPALSGPDAVVVDATLGLGGHSEALLAAHPRLTLIGLDRDTQALKLAGERLAVYNSRTHLVHAVYDELPEVLLDLGIPRVHGVLFDCGVSSLQLDAVERGFAYSKDSPLDMRMDPSGPVTAADILNTYSAGELSRILRDYGEERFAGRIAAAVVREREKEPFTTSGRLVDLLYASVPAATRRTGGHPAKRTFQALRIEVNAELDVLRRAIPAAVDALRLGGRIAVMSFQSLEDKIVKRVLVQRATSTTPPGLPVELPGHGPELKLLTRGSEQAGEQEQAVNPRAASVRLRAAERIREAT
ncbi:MULTISPECIES: 16S rRNA (cytosine(1402)-N(4))-methyltransferase RsmH [unclassified Crossiella]|uniref:16S rRNA (cytosine(1402)-N(4))-methyltransferase RsmH n=1 Tax=unclassified Crossiella TaxID=2620835 RepID=UPI0020004132|nr:MULTISPECIES: 16S rRNA (cytosine(1402)-N(4))-methyltransferase RsmH [unclassified Crossiella]MCK2243221.1 16S rRNA (cytosine(1402)-N(4))-methyltransferase RsmH [Crossiella sp. S99.2]MCK2254310.1 16S rRNA (cytosine(1402)-N(4))-methyltransferase RsmH [Crossiella sp. S99.1]